MSLKGQPCEKCDGIYTVQKTVVHKSLNLRKQYLYCCKCKHAPEYNTVVVPLGYMPPRTKKKA